MPSRYFGRHRAASSTRARQRAATGRTPRGILRPLSVSALSCGAVLALLHTVTDSPFGAMSQATALPRTAALALIAQSDKNMNALAETSAGTRPPMTPTPKATASGVATATMTPSKRTTTKAKPAAGLGKTWVMPVTGARFSSNYGWRWGAMHRGIDLAAPIGTPLRAMSTGMVMFAGQQSGYGNLVQVRYWDGTVTYFGHMNSIAVAVGQPVLPGQVVGAVGNTGQSTGPHLHLELHPRGGADVNPEPWLTAHGLKAR